MGTSIAGIGQLLARNASTDAELLEEWVVHRREVAFAQLMSRHGALVWGVCRRMQLSHADAEDVFQATFLVLFQQANLIVQRHSLSSWLYGIAWRVGMRLKRTAARERTRMQLMSRSEAIPVAEFNDDGVEHHLDKELIKLPRHYRDPLILCCLQGQTHSQAAQTLGWPVGSVAGRLSRAKAILRSRLIRQGWAPAITAGALVTKVSALVPPELTTRTLHAIYRGSSTGVQALAYGAISAMTIFRTLAISSVFLLASGLAAGWLLTAQPEVEPGVSVVVASSTSQGITTSVQSDLEQLQGAWVRQILNEVTGAVVAGEEIVFEETSYRLRYHPMENDGETIKSFAPAVTQLKPYVLLAKEKRIELIDFNNDAVKLRLPQKGPDWPTHLIERYLASYELTDDTLAITFDGKLAYKKDADGKPVTNREAILPLSTDQKKKRIVYHRVQTAKRNRSDELEKKLSDMLRPGEVTFCLKQEMEDAKTLKEGDHVDIEVEETSDQGKLSKKTIIANVEVMAMERILINKQEHMGLFLRLTREQSLALKVHMGKNKLIARRVTAR